MNNYEYPDGPGSIGGLVIGRDGIGVGTGPPYPPPPAAGSNAIGVGAIGTMQIGDITPFNPWDAIISQYGNSPRIDNIALAFDAAIDQTRNFDALYDLVWNVATAQGYGLDVWGRIVGIGRVIQVPAQNFFGFEEALPGSKEWNVGTFYSGGSATSNYPLADDAFRSLIYAKALTNISNGSIPSINRALMILFPGRGNAYCTEGAPFGPYFGFAEAHAAGWNQAPFYSGASVPRMQMTYTFTFPLTPVELAIVMTSGVLPKPTGVQLTIIHP